MMTLNRRLLAVLLSGVLAVGLLAGCGGNGDKKVEKPAEQVKVEAPTRATVGSIELTSQKLAGYTVQLKSGKNINSITNWKGKVVMGLDDDRSLTALNLKDNVLSLDRETFKDGRLVGENKKPSYQDVVADSKGVLYYLANGQLKGYKDGNNLCIGNY